VTTHPQRVPGSSNHGTTSTLPSTLLGSRSIEGASGDVAELKAVSGHRPLPLTLTDRKYDIIPDNKGVSLMRLAGKTCMLNTAFY